jgi:2-oxoglutarate dehydrogenase E1 component
VLAGYPALKVAAWVQEEPGNMGPWGFVLERAAGFLKPGMPLARVSRSASPSPATGNANVHKRELEQLVAEAFG